MKNDEYKILSKRFDKNGHCGQHIVYIIEGADGKVIKDVCAECRRQINGDKNAKR